MSLKVNIKAVRDYLVTQTMSAWAGVTVSHEPSELTDPVPNAHVNFSGATLDAETISVDRALLRFEIYGRFAKVADLSDAMIDKASDLRIALLSDTHPAGDVAYLTSVSEIMLTQEDNRDGVYEVGVAFECYVSAPRE